MKTKPNAMKRTLYECSHARVGSGRIYCGKGHVFSSKSDGGVEGRPWTEIIRQDARQKPLLYLLLFLLGGVFLALKAKQNWWQMLIGFGAGLIVGHLWW